VKRAIEGVVNHMIVADQEYMSLSPVLDHHSLEQGSLLSSDLPPWPEGMWCDFLCHQWGNIRRSLPNISKGVPGGYHLARPFRLCSTLHWVCHYNAFLLFIIFL